MASDALIPDPVSLTLLVPAIDDGFGTNTAPGPPNRKRGWGPVSRHVPLEVFHYRFLSGPVSCLTSTDNHFVYMKVIRMMPRKQTRQKSCTYMPLK